MFAESERRRRKGRRPPVSGSRRRRAPSKENANGWLATYGDMVTLLLTFFIVLFAFSNLDVERFRAIMSSFQGAIGVLDSGIALTTSRSVAGADNPQAELFRRQRQLGHEALNVAARLETFVQSEGITGSLTYELTERGIVIHFTDRVLFDLGEAELRPEAEAVLGALASEVIADWPNHIRVEGHTDDLPIATSRFPSNWELAAARAARVVRFLVSEGGLDPTRLSAAGYGEFRPIADNETSDGRARNRRVDIVLLGDESALLEPAAQGPL